jgi:3-(3-hydroxy-phenyl)propionate hydroxylase
VPVVSVLIGASDASANVNLADPQGRITRKYGASGGAIYLLRPDLHVCGRWKAVDAERVSGALRHALRPGRISGAT